MKLRIAQSNTPPHARHAGAAGQGLAGRMTMVQRFLRSLVRCPRCGGRRYSESRGIGCWSCLWLSWLLADPTPQEVLKK